MWPVNFGPTAFVFVWPFCFSVKQIQRRPVNSTGLKGFSMFLEFYDVFSEERCPCAWEFRWFHVSAQFIELHRAWKRDAAKLWNMGGPRLLLSLPAFNWKFKQRNRKKDHLIIQGSTSVLCFWHLLTSWRLIPKDGAPLFRSFYWGWFMALGLTH